MINTILLAATQPTVPNTISWSPQVALIISASSFLILLIASRSIKYPQVGAKLPVNLPGLGSPSIGTFVASMAFGHVVGAGIVLGLSNLGWLS
ncbi:photosystem I reaction center subunit PsaK [Chroococcidiopsis sp. FACHB-1243]|uniref:photosystem I reaction center subunit PsaK n=1 Tax=Chroococcidiopsis sp. [FACHB-1243] TaxID=2692781 RepID=UPI00177E9E24|nr:photosystem I reaction center subunit PsaK [Chroococcidiopsis sp. [FACHB-1243]]MBD2306291.1 photosystem I reaction center subunit PsaK [Chroococcidiopsis sp. [FACHB-1243]]